MTSMISTTPNTQLPPPVVTTHPTATTPTTAAEVELQLASLKRALTAWEKAFQRDSRRPPTEKDVRGNDIEATYREYNQLKVQLKTLLPTPSTTTIPPMIITESNQMKKLDLPTPTPSSQSIPSRTPLQTLRVQATQPPGKITAPGQTEKNVMKSFTARPPLIHRATTIPSTSSSLVTATSRSKPPPMPSTPLTTTNTTTTTTTTTPSNLVASLPLPSRSISTAGLVRPVPGLSRTSSTPSPTLSLTRTHSTPSPTLSFCAGPRSAHTLLKRKPTGLLAQIQSAAPSPIPTFTRVNEDMSIRDAEDDTDQPTPMPLIQHDLDDDIEMEDIEQGFNQSNDSSSVDADERTTDPHMADLPSFTSQPSIPIRRSLKRTHSEAADPTGDNENESSSEEEDDDDEEEGESSMDEEGESDDDDDADDPDAMEDEPPAVRKTRATRASRSSSPASPTSAATEPKPRKARATKPKAEKPVKEKKPRATKKKTSGIISTNYVRSDSKRSRGTARGPKSGKALRKEKWRQSQGLTRWKSRKEWAKEQAEKKEQGMYCEVLRPNELKHALDTAAKSLEDDSDMSVDELAPFRQFEREQFGVDHTASMEQQPDEDPLSPEAEAKEHKKKALQEQSAAIERANKAFQSATKSSSSTTRSVASDDSAQVTDASLLAVLREQFFWEHFRPGQLETIKRVLSCHNQQNTTASSTSSTPSIHSVLSIMPTGGGKSLIYQILSLLLPGLTLIISPLLSLMNDQLEHLPSFLRGAIWSSETTPKEVLELMSDLQANQIKILFISPEKLLSSGFQNFMLESVLKTKVSGMMANLNPTIAQAGEVANSSSSSSYTPGISLVVIDEVHCVAEWSHNFRNSYSRLGYVLTHIFRVPKVLGLTATATQSTVKQVCQHLNIPDENLIRVPLIRENLFLSSSLVAHEARFSAVVELLNQPPFKGLKSLIIYVNYKVVTEALSKYLKNNGYPSCEYYHAGLPLFQRHKIQTRFMRNKLNIIIATCAFGMGLDKPDIRGVIHFNLPRSFENYIQEIGRAGRDGDIAYCHAMWSKCDKEISDSLLYSNGVDPHHMKRLLEQIFDESKRIRPATSSTTDASMMDPEDEPLFRQRHYIPLEAEALRVSLELSEEVLGTILARLERTLNRSWIRLVAMLHNQCAIGFHKSNPKVLAQSSGVIRSLLEQNGWLPKSSQFSRCGVTFDHETSASSTNMPEYHSHEFQQLKQQKGTLTLNLCQTAIDCGLEISEVQREIVQLKARGEISVKWSEMAFIVEVLQWPNEVVLREDTPTLDLILTDLLGYLQKQESIASEKLSIMATALQIASLPSMRCTPHDSLERARRRAKLLLQLQNKRKNKTNDNSEEKQEAETEEVEPFFDLHSVMDYYFKSDDPSLFLRQLQAQFREASESVTSSTHTSSTTMSATSSDPTQRVWKELVDDLRLFLRQNGRQMSTGRELARICHGQKAPSHAAISKGSYQREKRTNGGGLNDDDETPSGVSPYATHYLWGRYKQLEFPSVLTKCEELLAEFQAYQQEELKEEMNERKRRIKRQKTIESTSSTLAASSSTAQPQPPVKSTGSSAALKPLLTSLSKPSHQAARSTRSRTTMIYSSTAPPTEEVVIPASDEENE